MCPVMPPLPRRRPTRTPNNASEGLLPAHTRAWLISQNESVKSPKSCERYCPPIHPESVNSLGAALSPLPTFVMQNLIHRYYE